MNDKFLRSDSLLNETRRLLNQYGLHARKGLAQHFLINRDVLHKITAAAELVKNDLVMEIGPGLGVLTAELVVKAGWVIAVELDNQLAAILKENIPLSHNLTVINRDILEIEPGDLLKGLPPEMPADVNKSYKVVANLPYYITSHVLRHFLEAAVKPKIMVITIQKELAQSIIAQPGEMSLLSNSVQFYGKPKIISYIPPECFYPPPKVHSAILRIDIYPRPAVEVRDESSFFRLLRAGFKANRKQIINSLSSGLGLPKQEIQPLLNDAGIDPKRRAETLSLEDWARLFQACIEIGNADSSSTR